MADPLNQFFDEAGSIVNKLLPNNPSQGIKIKPGNGVSRTDLSGSVSDRAQGGFGRSRRKHSEAENQDNTDRSSNQSGLKALSYTDKDGQEKPGVGGLTPLQYYKTTKTGGYPEYFVIPNTDYLKTTGMVFKDNYHGYENSGAFSDDPSFDFKIGQNLSPFDRGTLNVDESSIEFKPEIMKQSIRDYGDGIMTPPDNEDPVYFGFELEIDLLNSPLLNGELENFIGSSKFSSYTEVTERLQLVYEFKRQFMRIFKINGEILESNLKPADFTNEQFDSAKEKAYEGIFDLTDDKRYYYINKITGLQKLNEYNSPGTNKQFVAYNTDIITLTFFEDTTLNLGTLYSLYKMIYWSRLRGKSMIPENLLRFDCKVIVSELRNFVQVKNLLNSAGADTPSQKYFEVLKANLSRYVYNLYECQFFFDKPTHGDIIDLSSNLSATTTYDVSFNYKYSNMTFERFNFKKNAYSKISNAGVGPDGKDIPIVGSQNTTKISENKHISQFIYDFPMDKTSSTTQETTSNQENVTPQSGSDAVPSRRERRKARRAARRGDSATPTQNTIASQKATGLSGVASKLKTLNSPQSGIVQNQRDSFYKEIGLKFLNNLKSAALGEAQRQINYQFRFLNNSLDKVRNSLSGYGLGRMSPPINVYEGGATYNRILQNELIGSIRTFAGEALTGLITGRR